MSKSDLIDISVEIAAETDRAVLVHEGDKSKAVWLPRSQIEIEPSRTGGIFTVTLPEWLGIEKGLI